MRTLCPRQVLLALSLLLSSLAAAQKNPLIQFERARTQLELAREEAQRMEKLGELGLVSDQEVSRARVALRLAQLDFDEAVLELAGTRVRVVVADARRYSEPDGLDRIELTLAVPQIELPPRLAIWETSSRSWD